MLPGIYYLPMFKSLCNHGTRHSVVFPIKTTTAASIISGINQYGAQCIDFVEPQNEMDALAGYGSKDPNWPKKIIAEQTLLYHTMKSVPAFSNITVLGPALSNPANYSLLGNLDAISDAGNSHSAMCDANPGSTFYGTLGHRVSVVKASWPTKPVWVTETDYNDNSSNGGHCAVPDDVMAKYVARTQTERFNLGEPRIYWFSLKDRPQVIAGDEGLLRSNNSPKPAYIEMTNLMQVVGDATSSTPQPINWALVGSATIHHTLLQKSDGTYELLLWNEVPSWDTRTHVKISVPVQSATVHLPPSIGTATYYTFNTSYQMVRTPVTQRGSSFTIPVSDNISVLDFK
ncbi:MAG: hypothetical protein GIW94_01635 [Candidatus Eremiobacteraeota bacterium]|nr:hypothetical protein [Candidatus Eremiobacteraeota bacterium]MBC5824037.1 hypothetical protein [Candidatus Eremiobacteraeota bacterium]